MALPRGLYERVIDEELEHELAVLASEDAEATRGILDESDSHSILSQHLAKLVERSLRRLPAQDRLMHQVKVCNRVIAVLAEHDKHTSASQHSILKEAHRLLAVAQTESHVHSIAARRPETPLSSGCLLTGTRQDPSLVSQLRKEMSTSDTVDVLCSFVKWSGIRILEDELRAFTAEPGHRLRVITTSYLGATDLKAVEFLSNLPRTEVRLSYDTRRTRLHAKAYLFGRKTGFGTAYVGSSNLSHAAITDGLEWNVKVSQYESAHLWEKLSGTFETYWCEEEFERYDGSQRERLSAALRAEKPGDDAADEMFSFDIQPLPHQSRILDSLSAEREIQECFRNLVVAATGTGKTVVAAFDYRRFRDAAERNHPGRPARLLYVAHREEILRQSLACFRGVLRDQNFGHLLVGAERPASLDHAFISIQSYHSKELHRYFDADHYDYVVVDEFHHAAATSYEALLKHIRPRILLGLTATPERPDGRDILHHFGGRIAAEIRLSEAINCKLLSPFQYFGVSDSVDLSGLSWQRGGYAVRELDGLYTANDTRAADVVKSVRNKHLNVLKARGLGFCVSVQHAEYMAAFFRKQGIPAEALTGSSTPDHRRTVQARLKRREINFIFTVDLYNEGVDIPEIDTVLLLRPTESLTVFLQQIGRGLRLYEGKDYLTVLDFIGQAHRSYSFEARFRALMDGVTQRIDREIEDGCSHLPLGCDIHLERVAQEYVLKNIRAALSHNRAGLVARIASFESDSGSKPELGLFLDHYSLEVDDLYQKNTWSRLCVEAGVAADFSEPDENQLKKGLRRVAHIASARQIRRLLVGLQSRLRTPHRPIDEADRGLLLMLHFSLWGRSLRVGSVEESLDRLVRNERLTNELIGLLNYRLKKLRTVTKPVDLPFPCSLDLHGLYTRNEVLSGLGYWTLSEQREVREGVLYYADLGVDLFFVTLTKNARDYSPTTLYQDYAISPTLFHWQSQSTTADTSPTGQRYIRNQGRAHTVLIFVREEKDHDGLACPYVFLGPVDYVEHSGSRPMNIIWRLRNAMPAWLIPAAVKMAAA